MLDVTVVDAYYIDKVAWVIERLGDYVKRLDADLEQSSAKRQKIIQRHLAAVYTQYLGAMKAYYTRSIETALVLHEQVLLLLPELTTEMLHAKGRHELLAFENIKNITRELRIILRATVEMQGEPKA